MQSFQFLALARDVGKELRDLVRDVGPTRGEQVHLDYRITVIHVVGARRQETPSILVRREQHPCAGSAAEAVARAGRPIPVALGRMMGVGLPV